MFSGQSSSRQESQAQGRRLEGCPQDLSVRGLTKFVVAILVNGFRHRPDLRLPLATATQTKT